MVPLPKTILQNSDDTFALRGRHTVQRCAPLRLLPASAAAVPTLLQRGGPLRGAVARRALHAAAGGPQSQLVKERGWAAAADDRDATDSASLVLQLPSLAHPRRPGMPD
jgi:hypothetical protein